MKTQNLTALALAAAAAPGLAIAHPGHGADHPGTFLDGLLHPLSGADHLLAMVAIGLWAAQMAQGRGRGPALALPATFLASLLGGAVAARAGFVLPVVEPVILASVIVLGGLIAAAVRMPMGAALGMVALFGAAHGAAHAIEGPESGMAIYVAGFVAMTAALHAAGLVLGLAGARLTRFLGAGTAVAGATSVLAGVVFGLQI
ncbi:HupE/UreJ family protein [Frigidibacter sp. MR17.14]|uniref:HupE/UreJ family protein n=1 Tax=Frigidibacter sp. MR17.14 TaxID=3126509 RepID=UPI003012EFBC